jgi:hypothetical protein
MGSAWRQTPAWLRAFFWFALIVGLVMIAFALWLLLLDGL